MDGGNIAAAVRSERESWLPRLLACLHGEPIRRSIPGNLQTAYPRVSRLFEDPEGGLASIEALYVARRESTRPFGAAELPAVVRYVASTPGDAGAAAVRLQSLRGLLHPRLVFSIGTALMGVVLMATDPLSEAPSLAAERETRMVMARAGRLVDAMAQEIPEAAIAVSPWQDEIMALVNDMALGLGEGVFLRQSRALRGSARQWALYGSSPRSKSKRLQPSAMAC